MKNLFLRIYHTHRRRQLTKHLSNNIGTRVIRLIGVLALLIALNTFAMIIFERMAVQDAVWLSFTTLVTVGYGDFSPSSTPGRLATIVTMYGFAITMLSLLAAEIIDWRLRTSEKKRRGLWEFKNMTDHIQIINTPNVDTENYLKRLVTELQKTACLADMPIQLLTRKFSDGLPESLIELKLLHRTGAAEEGQILRKLNLDKASHIIILAREATDSISDSLTFDILSQVISINPNTNIVVEAVLDENRQRFLRSGANAVLRPIRAYPEMIARALSHPGTEKILEDLFNSRGDSLYRIPCCFNNIKWSDIILECIRRNIGTPLAYFSDGEVVMQPGFTDICSGDGLVILVKEQKQHDLDEIKHCFSLFHHNEKKLINS